MKVKVNHASPRLRRGTRQELGEEVEARDLAPTLAKVRPLTMVPLESLVELAHLVRAVLAFDIPGDFVECGAWCGGASFLMADLLRRAGVRNRRVWLFDSFEGLPPPKAIDGPAARAYAQNTGSPEYFDNCRASFAAVKRSAADLGLAGYTECVKGWFDQTLPAKRRQIGPIAILRIDGNWHASVRCCLDNLYGQVVDGGFVILHTYYTYDGCAIAAHEFLGAHRLAHPVEGIVGRNDGAEDYQSALFRKGGTTWKWLRQEYLVTEDLAALIPPGETFILASEQGLENRVAGGRHAIPFFERDGEYWGPPEDDRTAIRELERLRRLGARFIAFAWPAFWWLDYYAKFHGYLRATFRCILENDRLVVFDLRSSARSSRKADAAAHRRRGGDQRRGR
jgi:hypothetical protein